MFFVEVRGDSYAQKYPKTVQNQKQPKREKFDNFWFFACILFFQKSVKLLYSTVYRVANFLILKICGQSHPLENPESSNQLHETVKIGVSKRLARHKCLALNLISNSRTNYFKLAWDLFFFFKKNHNSVFWSKI